MRKNFLRMAFVLLCTMFGLGNMNAAGTMVGDFVRYTTLDSDLSGTYLMTWSFDGKPHSVYDAAKKYFNPADNAPQLFTKNIALSEMPDTLKDVDLNFAVKIAKATTEGTYSIQLPDGKYLGFDEDLGLITSATPLELYMSYVDDAAKMKTGWLISDENDFEFDASTAPATWLLASRPGQYTYVMGIMGGWNSPMYGVPHFYKMVSSKKIPEYADFERCTKNLKNWEGQYAVVFNYDGKPHSSISENHQFVADPAAVKVYESGQNIINVDVDLSVTVAKGVAEGAYTIQLPNGKYFTFDDDLGLVESETAGDVYIKYINIPSFREGVMISDEPKFITSYDDEDPGNYVVYFYRQSSTNYKAYRNKQAAQQYQMPLLFKKVEAAPVKTADFEFITENLSNWEGSWLMCWSFSGKPHTAYEESKKAFVPASDAPQLFYPNIATDEMPKTITGISMNYAVKIAKAATEGSYSMQLPDGKYLGFDDDLGLVTSATPLELYMFYVDDPSRYKTGTLISDENDFNFTSSSSPTTYLLASMPGQVTLVKGVLGNWHSPANAVARMYRAIEIPATGIALDKKSATLKLGETLNLTATLTPANTTTTDIIWKSTADTVASVDEGMVTPISNGETKIIVSTADGKFTDTCVVTVGVTADRRIFAYDLRMTEVGNVCTFAFKTNIAPTEANIVLYRDGAIIDRRPVTVSDALNYTIAINKDDLSGNPGEKMAWGVEVKAGKVEKFAEIFNEGVSARQRMFLNMDLSTESPYFGRIYANNRAVAGNVKGAVYDQAYNMVKADAVTLGNAARPAVDSEGTVYWSDYGDATAGIRVMNPETFESNQLFYGSPNSDGLYTSSDGHPMCGSTMCAEIWGAGAETQLWVQTEDGGTDLYANGAAVFQLGQADGSIVHTWDAAPTKAVDVNNGVACAFSIRKTAHGLWWGCNRSDNLAPNFALVFVTDGGVRKFDTNGFDGLTACAGGGMNVNADESKLYLVNQSGKIIVYDVTWSEDTVPTLTRNSVIETGYNSIGSIIFDPAGNMVTSAGTYGTKMNLVVYSMPTDNNEIIIPAAKSQAIEFAGLGTLEEVLEGKTILRVLNDNSGVYALAVDAADAPTLVKADFEGNVVTTYATDFCSHKGTAAGTRDLADIALTADGVLLGINAEHNTTTRTEGRATLLYKWNADGNGSVLINFDNIIGSNNNPVAGNFSNATTDMLAFNGTLADGVLALRAMTQGSGNRSRIGLFKFVDGAITLKNTAKDLASWSATSGIYMTNALTAGNFVWSATGVATIEFSSDVALTTTEPEAIAATATMALPFIAIKGYSFATIDGKKVMMIPSATDVKLYNVTSGLNQAATMETLNATQTVESPMYMYAGFAGDKVVLVRDGVVETIAYGAPVTGMDEVVTNSEIQKVILNGTLYIIRDGVMYNVQGQMVK